MINLGQRKEIMDPREREEWFTNRTRKSKSQVVYDFVFASEIALMGVATMVILTVFAGVATEAVGKFFGIY